MGDAGVINWARVGSEKLTDSRTTAPRGVILHYAIYSLAAAACLLPWVTPAIALALGAGVALVATNPLGKTTHRLSKSLLQICVVLLGFGMDLGVVLRAGASGASLAAVSISLTLLLGWVLGKTLRIRRITATLISAGTAICGGSAIAAVGTVLDAGEGDMTVAMGTVFLLNAVALYLFPVIGHALHLSPHQFGVWAGIGIHDVSSVVGAASHFGVDALQTATAVKLSRALWIVPLTIAMAYARRRWALAGGEAPNTPVPRRSGKVQVPWFIGLFVLASVVRSIVPPVAGIAPTLTHIATIGFTLTLFLVGSGLSLHTIRSVGWRAMVQGALLWGFISAGSLLVVLQRG